MAKRKSKNEDFPVVAIIFLLGAPLALNPGVLDIIIATTSELLAILFGACVIGLIFYWLLSGNKKKQNQYKINEHFQRPETTNERMERIERLEKVKKRDFYKLSPKTASAQEAHEKWSLILINSLEWKRFEELCAAFLKEKGYKSKLTGAGADGGIDIQLFKESHSSTKSLGIVQCKAWNSKVGVKHVRELFGVMAAEKSPIGFFITTSTFTKEAEEFAEGKKLKLISGISLLKEIQKLPEERQQLLLDKTTTGDYVTPSCPSCENKMVKRTSKKGQNLGKQFWGCTNFPKCRNTLQIRKAA